MLGILVISRHETHDMVMDGAWPQIINVTLYYLVIVKNAILQAISSMCKSQSPTSLCVTFK